MLRPELKKLRDDFDKDEKHEFLISLGYQLKLVKHRSYIGSKVQGAIDRRASFAYLYPYYYKTDYNFYGQPYESAVFTDCPGYPRHPIDGAEWLTADEAHEIFADVLAPINTEFIEGNTSLSDALNELIQQSKGL